MKQYRHTTGRLFKVTIFMENGRQNINYVSCKPDDIKGYIAERWRFPIATAYEMELLDVVEIVTPKGK